MKKRKDSFITGTGPTINNVTIQYSCGKEGYEEQQNKYSQRKKGYGKPQHSWSSLMRVFHYVGPDKWKFTFVMFVTLLSVLISLLGAFISAPLVDGVLTPASYAATGWISIDPETYGNSLSSLSKIVFNMVDWTKSNAQFQAMGVAGGMFGIMLGLYILAFFLSIYQAVSMTKIGTDSLKRMRNDMFSKMQDLPLSYFDRTPHGDIMSRFTNDVDNISQLFINGMLEIFTSIIFGLGILFFIFYLNWLLALVTIFIELVGVLIVVINVHRSVSAFSETQISMGEFNGFAEEVLSGLKVVKCFSKEEDMNKIFKSIDYRHTLHNRRSVFLSSVNIPIVNNINNMATGIIAMLGAILIAVGSNIPGTVISVGILISYIAFLRMFSRPFNSISNMMTMLQASLAGAERIFQMIDQEPEPAHNKSLWRSFKAEDGQYYWTNGKDIKHVRGEVDMKNVYFSYIKGQQVLKDITMYAKPGQKIALVGSTGAGKTTITNMLTRFYDIDSGTITIDGIDIKEIDRVSMRRSMTLVLQDTHLFTGTIYDNIRYGRLKASDQECEKAAKIACANSFIEKLPDGYNTVISGSNASLSQGQKQLLSIARCAVGNPPILILDEATSSIDTRTERLISKGMDNLMRGKTTFVIAHRLSTIRYADCIMVMDHGKIIERGTHDQLIAQKGYYYKLWTGKAELQ